MSGNDGEDDTPLLERTMHSAMNTWNGFRRFMWNPDERTVMGRGGNSWAKISLFYLVYYICLAGFWAALLAIFLQFVSYDKPSWTAYVSTPALTSVPVPDDQGRIRWTPADEESVKSVTADMMAIYEGLQRTDPDFVDCMGMGVGSVDDGQRFCNFDVTTLGECNTPPFFGWDTLKPCLFLRLNRVYNWIPENYENQPDDIPDRIRNVYQDNNVAINCFPRKDKDKPNFNSSMPFPSAGIPFEFFPHLIGAYSDDRGRSIQPIVAVQVSITPNVAVNIECQTYTGNIRPRGGLYDTDEESRASIYLTARKDEDD